MSIGSLRMLRHFIAASQAGNFHRAAKMEMLTQSAITKSIQQLEEGLGVSLFDRSPRGVKHTQYGQALYARARRVQEECDLIEKELAEMSSGQAGQLTIGAGSVWSSMLLPPVLSRLSVDKPSAEFTILRSSGARFVSELEDGTIDIGLGAIDTFVREASTHSDDYLCEELLQIKTCFFAHESHPLHAMNDLDVADLSEFPYTVFRSDIELRKRISIFFMERNLSQPHQALSSDSISAMMQMMKSSQMTTCLPEQFADLGFYFGVRPLALSVSPWSFSSGMIYRKSAADYPLLTNLVQQLKTLYSVDSRSWK